MDSTVYCNKSRIVFVSGVIASTNDTAAAAAAELSKKKKNQTRP